MLVDVAVAAVVLVLVLEFTTFSSTVGFDGDGVDGCVVGEFVVGVSTAEKRIDLFRSFESSCC